MRGYRETHPEYVERGKIQMREKYRRLKNNERKSANITDKKLPSE